MAKGYSQSVSLGNAGEHLVAARLLAEGFHVFMADRNNRAFDLAAFHGGRHSLIRVKTTNTHSAVWTRKKDGTTFHDSQPRGDFVGLVDVRPGIASALIYIIPTPQVQAAIDAGRKDWTSKPKRDGGERVDSPAQRVWLDDRINGPAYRGYAVHWLKYLEAWGQLRGSRAPSSAQ